MNVFDGVVIGVVLLSALLAFMRGLVAEVLSVGGWVGAALAALYSYPYVQPLLRAKIHTTWIADACAAGGVFLIVLIILIMISSRLARAVRDSALNAVDRSLGFLFGLLRGTVLVCLGWLVLVWLVPPADQPGWIAEARTKHLVENGADVLVKLAPAGMRDVATERANAEVERARQALEAEALRRLATPRPEGPKPAGAAGGAGPSVAPGPVKPAGGAATPGGGAGGGTAGSGTVPPETGYRDRDRGDMERMIRNANPR
ncbi:membrane protein required for colicin V production [uncultured Gammaproteobacteria bacterium]